MIKKVAFFIPLVILIVVITIMLSLKIMNFSEKKDIELFASDLMIAIVEEDMEEIGELIHEKPSEINQEKVKKIREIIKDKDLKYEIVKRDSKFDLSYYLIIMRSISRNPTYSNKPSETEVIFLSYYKEKYNLDYTKGLFKGFTLQTDKENEQMDKFYGN